MKRLLIIIPAYNEEKMIGKVLHSIPRKLKGVSQIKTILIDDGSQDNTAEVARKQKIIVLRHVLNRGLGAALGTGFAYAKKHSFDIVITLDGDGQHDIRDLSKLLKPIFTGTADVVIGSRLLKTSNMPLLRKVINNLSNVATWLLFSVWTSDSQSGLRAFNKYAINRIKIKSQRMEVSSEIFKEVNRLRLKVVEVPIRTIYTNYSLKKGQQVSNAPNVLWKLVLNRFS